jgi:alpha-tubulin suppressor-like RCC1 family protein
VCLSILAVLPGCGSYDFRNFFKKQADPGTIEFGEPGDGPVIGGAPAFARVSRGDFSTTPTPLGAENQHQLLMRNMGELAASNFSFRVEPPSQTAHFTATSDCVTLKPQGEGSCQITIRFHPLTVDLVKATLVVSYDAGRGKRGESRIPIESFSDKIPYFRFERPEADFGDVVLGQDGLFPVKLIFNGSLVADQGLTIPPGTEVSFSSLSGPWAIQGHDCAIGGGSLSSTCTVTLRYRPVSQNVVQETDLRFSYNDGNQPRAAWIHLKGKGTEREALTISASPGSADFGTIVRNPKTPPAVVTIGLARASGNEPATITAITAPTSPKLSMTFPTSGACASGMTFSQASTCQLRIAFDTSSTTPVTLSAQKIVIAYTTYGMNKTLEIPIAGKTVAPPTIAVGAATVNLTPMAAFRKQTGTISYTITSPDGLQMASVTMPSPPTAQDPAVPLVDGSLPSLRVNPGTQNVSVAYTPNDSGASHSSTFNFVFDDGTVDAPNGTTRAVTVNGSGLAPLEVDTVAAIPFNHMMFGQPVQTQSVNLALYGTAGISSFTGTALATGSATGQIQYAGGGSYPGSGGTCAGSKTGGTSCSIAYSVTPPATGASVAAITPSSVQVQYVSGSTITRTYTNNGANIYPVPRVSVSNTSAGGTGTGTGFPTTYGAADPSNPSFAFSGTVLAGESSSADAQFTFTNTAAAGNPFEIRFQAAPSITGTNANSFSVTSGGACSGNLAAQAACAVSVRFSPKSSGALSAQLVLRFREGNGTFLFAERTITINLSGTGGSLVRLSSPAGSVAFGNVTHQTGMTTRSLAITRAAGLDATSITISAAPGAPYSATGCTINARASSTDVSAAVTTCNVTVSMNTDASPPSATPYSSSLTLTFTNPGAGVTTSYTVSLSGTIVKKQPDLRIATSPANGTFAASYQGDPTRELTATITNQGMGAASALSLSLTGTAGSIGFKGGSAPGTGGSCSVGGGIAAGANCTVVLTMTTAANGSWTPVLNVGHQNAYADPMSVTQNLSGSVGMRVPNITPSTASVAFGKIRQGQASSASTITFTNGGLADATNLTFSGLSAPHGYAPGGAPGDAGRCGTTLASGANCTLLVRFSPSAVGLNQNASITWSYKDSLGASYTGTTISLSGHGTTQVRIFAGGSMSCVIDEVRRTKCWGSNASGQLGRNQAPSSPAYDATPGLVDFGAGVTATKLSLGDQHACALLDTGAVTCWGNNGSGRLGLGRSDATVNGPRPSGTLLTVNLGASAIDVAAGPLHSCAVLQGGAVKCWGSNGGGRLGIDSSVTQVGTTAAEMSALPAVALGSPATSIAAGSSHSCATLSTGELKCWGNNQFAQIGQPLPALRAGGTATQSGEPAGANIPMASLIAVKTYAAGSPSTVVSVHAGYDVPFVCLRGNAGQVKCFGKTTPDETAPSPFWGLLGNCFARPVGQDAGTASLCSAVGGGYTQTTHYGRVVSDMAGNLPTLALGAGSPAAQQVITGGRHTCVVTTGGSLRCWGMNDFGQLGIGSTSPIGGGANDMANLAESLAGVVEAAAGKNHTCAALAGNTVRCWGSGTSRENGSTGGATINAAASGVTAYDGTVGN